MKKIVILFSVLIFCCNSSNTPLKHIVELPKKLYEVSGIEKPLNSNLIWVINDSGNSAKLFGINEKGNILNELKIEAKNNDWEDLASDEKGNLYIGDFGNNQNKRKNLAILKVSKDSLNNSDKIRIERILFRYENQIKYPPKKKQKHFDCEAFFYYNDSLYLFTKSRVKNDFGTTNLYKIPAKLGNHIASQVSTFKTCDNLPCWITSADISEDGKAVALLTLNQVWIFTNFENDNFFSGESKTYNLGFESQKESIYFKNNNTLLIADERANNKGGNLYELKIN